MQRLVALLTAILVAAPVLGSPAEAVAAALADCRKLPADLRVRVRYLSLYNLPGEDRTEALQVLDFHVNSLSREAELTRPARVGPDLVRVTLDDYAWDPFVYGRLGKVDPYFHVQLDIGGIRKAAAAPWLDAKAIGELIVLTQSQTPILRLDWFVVQTATQDGRKAGYYDFLGLGKKEADFQDLVGADPEKARQRKREVAAVVARSGVTLNNRSMVRMDAVGGPYWFTQDYAASADKKNTLRLLDGDAQPDASEQYGTLPNGLFAFWLQDGKGNRQNTAPDTIASDGEASGTDRRVHVGLSCIRCHAPGIQPINDWARRAYRPPLALQSIDYEKYRRLRQLYLSDLQRLIKRDQTEYAEVLLRVNGLTPAANAQAYGRFWDRYVEQDRSPADCARELGVTEEALIGALKGYAKQTGALDPLLAGLVQTPALPIRSEHWEEIFGTAALIVKGAQP